MTFCWETKAEKHFQDNKDVKTIQFSLGGENPMSPGQSNQAMFFVQYDNDTKNFEKEKEQVVKDLQKMSGKGEWKNQDFGASGGSNEIKLYVYGDSSEDIKPVVKDIQNIMKKNKDLKDIDSSIAKTYAEYTLVADQEKLSKMGLTAAQIGMGLSNQHDRPVLTTIKKDGKDINVYVEAEKQNYETIDETIEEVVMTFQEVMFDFKDLAGEDLEGTGNEFVYVYSVGLKYKDGNFAVYPVDSTISYQAYFSEGEKSGDRVYEDIGLSDVVEVTFNVYNNRPPVADAGPDQEVDEGEEVEFDGSGTTDPDVGDVLTYEWNFGDGSPTESGIDLVAPTHTYADNGVYTVELTVTDDHSVEDTDEMTVTVLNVAPICIGSNNGPIAEGSTATISISSVYDPGTADTFTYYYDWDN